MIRMMTAAGAALVLAGCAGQVRYEPPTGPVLNSNFKVVDRPRDQVWAASVPELGRRFFTINNLDKSSGLINVSYSGDPEAYIDCGQVHSYVKNARGERNYDFPAARERQQYEVMDRGLLMAIDRRMGLEGRVNLIFEEVDASRTRVTANTRYVVTRSQQIRAADGRQNSITDSTSFNSGGAGSMGPVDTAITCKATGALEDQILKAIN